MDEIISFSNVTKTYGHSRGIKNVSLSVAKGDIFGFMGPNGAGKSTTIKSMLGLIFANSGNIQLLGKDIKTQKKQILKDVGYMPSEAMFYSGMKVVDILNFSANMRGKECKEQQRKLCERLDLDIYKKVEDLSLGNRKKVSIVCTMQHEPKLYILDEPTSGLDPLIQKEFFNLLLEKNEKGATIFLSSHILTEVKNYCTSGAIIKEGCLVTQDSIEHLLHSNIRTITLRGIGHLPEQFLNTHVKNQVIESNQIKFIYDGDVKELLVAVKDLSITDFLSEEADIEDVFMHYYQKEGNNNGNF